MIKVEKFERGNEDLKTRLAIIGIIVEDLNATDTVNHLLHDYGAYIIGRMGVPYRQRNVNVISVIIDAPGDVINSLAGKLGKIDKVTAKTVYSNV